MRRSLLTLVAFTALAAWAGAQGSPPPLTAAEQARLFKSNRTLLEHVVNHGLDLANADTSLKRAEECRKTAKTLANYLERAAGDQDPDRVVELAGLMGDVVRDGLVPNLDAARAEIRPGDPREGELLRVRDLASSDVDGLKLPADGKVGDSQKVKDALAALQTIKAALVK